VNGRRATGGRFVDGAELAGDPAPAMLTNVPIAKQRLRRLAFKK
jgi:hypothetical protein